jgi:hypothetical protein
MANTDKTELVLPMIYGVVLHVPLYYGVHWYSHYAATHADLGPAPLWYVLSYPLLWAIAATAPGFVAGWFSRHFAFLLGGAIGFIASMIEQPIIDMNWGGGVLPWVLVLRIAAYALSPAIVSAVACAAGQHARPRPRDPEPAVQAPRPAPRRK